MRVMTLGGLGTTYTSRRRGMGDLLATTAAEYGPSGVVTNPVPGVGEIRYYAESVTLNYGHKMGWRAGLAGLAAGALGGFLLARVLR